MTGTDFDDCARLYVRAMIWIDFDDVFDLRGYHLTAAAAAQIAEDVDAFLKVATPLLLAAEEELGTPEIFKRAGEDFFLSRQGYDYGFAGNPELWGAQGAALHAFAKDDFCFLYAIADEQNAISFTGVEEWNRYMEAHGE